MGNKTSIQKTRKYSNVIFFLAALVLMISCNTVTEPDNGKPYMVFINRIKLDLSDTLKIDVLSLGGILKGTVDFGDGTNENYSNSNPLSVLTISHSYSKYGTYYVSVTVVDKNGNVNNPIVYTIEVKHYYNFNFPVGMKWTYKYGSGSSQSIGDRFSNSTKGIHTWEVLSYSSEKAEYTFKLTRNDTVQATTQSYDSTNIRTISQTFTVKSDSSSLKYNLPTGYLAYLTAIPNKKYYEVYPLTIQSYWTTTICEDKIGIKSYTYSEYISRYSQRYEYLQLINYTLN